MTLRIKTPARRVKTRCSVRERRLDMSRIDLGRLFSDGWAGAGAACEPRLVRCVTDSNRRTSPVTNLFASRPGNLTQNDQIFQIQPSARPVHGMNARDAAILLFLEVQSSVVFSNCS